MSGALPGGDFAIDGFDGLVGAIAQAYPWLDRRTVTRLVRMYGTRAREILSDARSQADLGRHFGADLYENEVRYLMRAEWAFRADDVLWRRSKLGLRLNQAQREALDAFMQGA